MLLKVEDKMCDIDHSYPLSKPLDEIDRMASRMHRDIGTILDLRARISTGHLEDHDIAIIDRLCRKYSAPIDELVFGMYDKLPEGLRREINTKYVILRSLLKLAEH